ncbi:crystallin J1A-like [Dendronephthya gigantea]|uniref:crystallin J1A-like n=1 Tax=Dendronephthya gigantea TaxID=151771 RepID=UPI00106DBDBD|nr:crystallin J1A-like [Dendronephthya gigantea]
MDITNRKLGCILASAIADAAAQPLHWIYDLEKFQATVGNAEEIEFWSPSANAFYCLETGKQSCYGDQTHAILISLARQKEFDLEDLKKATYKMFGPDSEYAMMEEALKTGLPIKSGWRNGSIKYFLKKMESNSEETGNPDDAQIDGVTKLAPLVAMYAGHPDLLFHVEDVIRMTQDDDMAVVSALTAARIIERCLLTTNTSDTMLDVVKHVMNCLAANDRTNPQDLDRAMISFLKEVIDSKDVPHTEVVPKRFVNS